MGRPFDTQNGLLANVQMDLSHQEMDRLVTELTQIWESFTMDGYGQPTGIEWLPVEGVAEAIYKELGYEDMGEFEDALHGSFDAFLDKFPNVEKKQEDRGNGPRTFFKIKPDPPKSEWRPVRMTVRVTDSRDLWRVCLKSPYARIEIPELEFEISADGKRHIDSMYNHIGAAVFNLSMYVGQRNSGLSDDHKEKIMDTVMKLNEFLDVSHPWTWILHDPSGLSEFKPMEGVEVVWLEREAEDATGPEAEAPTAADSAPAAGEEAAAAAAQPAAEDKAVEQQQAAGQLPLQQGQTYNDID